MFASDYEKQRGGDVVKCIDSIISFLYIAMHQINMQSHSCCLSIVTGGALVASILVTACGGSKGDTSLAGASVTNPSATVMKVVSCATDDTPEIGLQGQVPAAVRALGFQGFNCNLKKVGQFEGEGGSWSAASFTDRAGRTCAYYSTTVPLPGRVYPGVPVIDITDPSQPKRTASLTTTAMLDPWESLRVSASRALLIADNGQNGGGGPEIDIYDLSADCTSPQLLSSLPIGTGADGGKLAVITPKGHEGNISPDGLTYYVGDSANRSYRAVDISNTTRPQMIADFDISTVSSNPATSAHGLSVSQDGNRMYGVIANNVPVSGPVFISTAENASNGFVILDTAEVQQRKPNAQMKTVSTTFFVDGTFAQHTIPITIKGNPFLVVVDEGGSAGLASAASFQLSCAAGVSPFPMARLFDISDEKKPVMVSKFALETHDPKNCTIVGPDLATASGFVYGSHYCSVDNRDNATIMACSYFNSGLRVFDIRDPAKPQEIAYYNPGSKSSKVGSAHALYGQWKAGGPDWCNAQISFNYEKRQMTTMCQDNGVIIMQFADNTWPFTDSTPSRIHN